MSVFLRKLRGAIAVDTGCVQRLMAKLNGPSLYLIAASDVDRMRLPLPFAATASYINSLLLQIDNWRAQISGLSRITWFVGQPCAPQNCSWRCRTGSESAYRVDKSGARNYKEGRKGTASIGTGRNLNFVDIKW